MECDRFIEEKVGDAGSPEFSDHLAECAACRRDIDEYDEIRELYREASTERYSGGRPRLRRAAWPVAAAAAVLVAVFATIVMPPSTPVVTIASGRLRLEPWSREDARLDREMDDLWRRVEELERRPR